ncbi:YqgE/AlgH family protein [soil metagenome]
MFAENKLKPATGRLLIAEPFLHDDYFRRCVILITEHNEKGTIGFILNKPLEVMVHEAVPEFPDYENPAFFGGPVQRDQLYFIHTSGALIDESVPVTKNIFWQGDFECVKSLIANKTISEKQIRFFIGYAGWEPGQLEREIEEKSWFVSKTDSELIFDVAPALLWTTAVKKMGAAFAPMANFPEDPTMN